MTKTFCDLCKKEVIGGNVAKDWSIIVLNGVGKAKISFDFSTGNRSRGEDIEHVCLHCGIDLLLETLIKGKEALEK